jgi:Flp pilus assembly protein TadG
MNKAGKPKAPRRRFSEQGQSAVELAFVVPIVIVLLLAIADFGRVFFLSIAVNNAARAGAQYGSQTNTTAADFAVMETQAATDFGCVASGGNACPNFPNWNTPTATECTCGTANPPTNPACSTISSTYCADASSKAVFVTVNTSATFTPLFTPTFLTYFGLGIPSTITLTGKAIMQVQEQ